MVTDWMRNDSVDINMMARYLMGRSVCKLKVSALAPPGVKICIALDFHNSLPGIYAMSEIEGISRFKQVAINK